MSTFTKPAPPSDGIQWKDHLGALLLVEPLEYVASMTTTNGDTDAVRATVSVIDGPGAGDTYQETLIFPTKLVIQTKRMIGSKVLGRLVQGEPKPGKNPPWLLDEASEADETTAEAWLAKSKPIVSADPPF